MLSSMAFLTNRNKGSRCFFKLFLSNLFKIGIIHLFTRTVLFTPMPNWYDIILTLDDELFLLFREKLNSRSSNLLHI